MEILRVNDNYLTNILQVNREKKNWVIQPVKVEKDDTWKQDIIQAVNYCCETGTVPDVTLPAAEPLSTTKCPFTRVSHCQL